MREEIGKSGEPWYIRNRMSFTRQFLLGIVFFRTALPCSGGYHLERGGMLLHGAVGINYNKGATKMYRLGGETDSATRQRKKTGAMSARGTEEAGC